MITGSTPVGILSDLDTSDYLEICSDFAFLSLTSVFLGICFGLGAAYLLKALGQALKHSEDEQHNN